MFRPPRGTPDGWGFEESHGAATCISNPRHLLARRDISDPNDDDDVYYPKGPNPLLRTHCNVPDMSPALLSSRIHVPLGEVATSSWL